MACTISISQLPDDIWMINNRVFGAFAAEVVAQFSDDDEVVAQVQLAEAFHGASLDALYAENPELAIRVRDAFQTVASDVALGRISLLTGASDSTQIRLLFSNLVRLLERFHPERKQPPVTQ